MKVKDIMTSDVCVVDPNQSIAEAAKRMVELDVGLLPVGENDRLVGMISDRDIALRAVAVGKGAETKVRDVMTRDVKYVYEDREVEEAAESLAQQQLRRMPVLDRSKRLVGIISLADIAMDRDVGLSGAALRGISQPGGAHCQSDRAA
ncbi:MULTISPECIES: CBS domain-containing protein [Methylosinus]|uniref:CBS domain-containing protein n=1 Tax=Methylosinus trichosporium (strain ATCC 35070 / NCIMB 11131 / UNIQEM 75 / OB3b) TaxID=595536 RepID=A0A2D2CW89_METT3|nr:MULTISPECIES: CBS domain-containing protein [Methylosinus]ATQ67042.1 CBS domain-containing protein [Methylosinus trichosporium OB3b]OBS50845.1 inosine-5-monophosphate dehydrogenase [Methylosinus sp. 3S-1]